MEPRPKVSTLLLDFLGFIRKYLKLIYIDMIYEIRRRYHVQKQKISETGQFRL